MHEISQVGYVITDCVTAFFYRLEPTLEPHKRLFACMIVRALRDWFECRRELFKPDTDIKKDRRRVALATNAFDWLMSEEDFIGVRLIDGKKTGVISFYIACTGLGLDPKVIRKLVWVKRWAQLEAINGEYFGRYSRDGNPEIAPIWSASRAKAHRCLRS